MFGLQILENVCQAGSRLFPDLTTVSLIGSELLMPMPFEGKHSRAVFASLLLIVGNHAFDAYAFCRGNEDRRRDR